MYDRGIIPSALNYTGSKHKLLPQLLPLFPDDSRKIVDLFAGGGSVGLNLINIDNIKFCLLNDIDNNVISFYKYLSAVDLQEFLFLVEKSIEEYGLSNTKKYGYDYYHTTSGEGLAKYNKEKYLKLRNDYNETRDFVLFYLLIVYGFNNQIRFNKNNEFNLPVGKRDFNIKMENKIKIFIELIQKKEIQFSSLDFREVSNNDIDFFYVDPPYLISTASYTESNKWTETDEQDLYEYLDKLDDKNIKFALSNVIFHKNQENEILKSWAKKYNMHILNYNYNNSNYQSKARYSETVEVLVTNY